MIINEMTNDDIETLTSTSPVKKPDSAPLDLLGVYQAVRLSTLSILTTKVIQVTLALLESFNIYKTLLHDNSRLKKLTIYNKRW